MAKKIEFIDLRKELGIVQARYSFYWAALRSAQLNSKCGCLDEYEMPKSSCSKCMGTGHLFIDKLVKLQRSRSTPGIDLDIKPGKINTSTVNFSIESAVAPKNTDWVLELDLDESTGIPRQPFTVTRAFKIQESKPQRGKEGRIEFWYCYAEERNFSVGKQITQRKKPAVTTTTTESVTAQYAIFISTLDGSIKSLNVSSTYDIPVTMGLGQSASNKLWVLSPRTSPPDGKLSIGLIDGTNAVMNTDTV